MICTGPVGILCVLGGLVLAGQPALDAWEVAQVHPLHIALHDGFTGQKVRISVNGQTVLDRPVRTDLRISRADAVDISAPAQRVTLAATVEPSGITGTIDVDAAATPYVSLDLQPGGGLLWTTSAEPFRYM